ncbi:MBL fold metallo-hydrolase [Bdellovibrio sp.]|uniref:MBL fold metallo-hydrolase n=1 Tax=Bdellovibrio sp. TaxID=28201 RepID=UPI0039E52102
MRQIVREFFDKATWTLTYVVYDEETRDAIVIDPVWDYDPTSSRMNTASVDDLVSFVRDHQLKVHYILETHAHADHFSGAQVLKERLPGAKVGIGSRIVDVQKIFQNVFNLESDFETDGSQFDVLLEDGASLCAGSLALQILHTPGHTPACSSYVIGESVFTGDALFMPDSGTGRCDFPLGSAEELYKSVHTTLYALPDHYKVYVGHDYMPGGRALSFVSTIGEEKRKNIQLTMETSKEQFVVFREARDKTLAAPRLLLPSVQVNIAAGCLPKPETNGTRYLKIPVR